MPSARHGVVVQRFAFQVQRRGEVTRALAERVIVRRSFDARDVVSTENGTDAVERRGADSIRRRSVRVVRANAAAPALGDGQTIGHRRPIV
jgi:hypothetical protein